MTGHISSSGSGIGSNATSPRKESASSRSAKQRRRGLASWLRNPERRRVMESKFILVSVADAARMLSIGRTAAWELVRKRKIKSVKIGRTRRVPIAAIEEYV